MCQCPREKRPTPSRLTRLFGIRGRGGAVLCPQGSEPQAQFTQAQFTEGPVHEAQINGALSLGVVLLYEGGKTSTKQIAHACPLARGHLKCVSLGTATNQRTNKKTRWTWTGELCFISWSARWSCSRCRTPRRSWSSCWGSAAGAARSAAATPGPSRRARPPATSRSSCPSAGGPCCWSRATPSSLAWRGDGS